jgi:hypothetical protein
MHVRYTTAPQHAFFGAYAIRPPAMISPRRAICLVFGMPGEATSVHYSCEASRLFFVGSNGSNSQTAFGKWFTPTKVLTGIAILLVICINPKLYDVNDRQHTPAAVIESYLYLNESNQSYSG